MTAGSGEAQRRAEEERTVGRALRVPVAEAGWKRKVPGAGAREGKYDRNHRNRRMGMKSPAQVFQMIYGKIRKEWKAAFLGCFLAGLLVHMPVLLSDIPNHDGLASLYFDQNMITSGRWFLTVACGISSYYTLPWVIGLLGLFYLGCAAAAVCELLEVRKTWAGALIGSLMAVFPAMASTFAYVFTLDGYMMGILLAVLAVLLTKKYSLGFLPGAVCLAFSMGIYQAYLPMAMILSLFSVLMLLAREGDGGKNVLRGKIRGILNYLYMGILGAGLYYGILQVLLKIQGKQLDTYQGIDGMVAGTSTGRGIFRILADMYMDFFRFSFRGNVLFQNVFSAGAWVLLGVTAVWAAILWSRRRKYWKNPALLVIMVLVPLILPGASNVILLVSPGVNYHLLMRYQWVLYAVGAVALGAGCRGEESGGAWPEWTGILGASLLVFCYCITDNIAYTNLQRRYEKTYAYCVRLLDRIEQTEGYYQGIPIAMVGVVGDDPFPVTDLTLPVTSGMIGLSGDSLLYMGENYEIFIRNYLGATLNILPAEAMEEMYYSEEYIAMDSFPGKNSIRVIGGIMYIKTENAAR